MLCQFIFKNFKSYRDETVMDMQATNVDEHSSSLLTNEKDNKAFLPVSVIYGPNAGGKSGILEALAVLISIVKYPIDLMNLKSQNLANGRYLQCYPFAFDSESPNSPIEFTIFFRNKGIEFKYSITLHNGNVVSESLYKKNIGGKKSATVFERNSNEIVLGTILRKKINNLDVNAQMPYITFLAINHNFEVINTAVDWFTKCIILNYSYADTYNEINFIASMKKTLLQILQEVDIPINDYLLDFKNDDKGNKVLDSIRVIRKMDGIEYTLDMLQESGGTKKLFGLLPLVLLSLANGGLLLADELDANLHPKLLRYIIKLFTNNAVNINNAQLIFTSHDVTTMKNDIFRRDEIWFAVKDTDGASAIYSLYEIRNEDGSRIKSSSPYDKQYMDGRYGADPYLSEMINIQWDD
ncbi:MAG: ATP-binding protein [Oscillospiraceae bacterium]|nr:ATP-binding protein [Oscillospiraceae bacterium]